MNDFPKSVVNSIINKTLNTPSNNEGRNNNNNTKKKKGMKLLSILAFLDVMPTMLDKLKELYMKDVLNMPGMTKIVLCLTILMNV